MGKTLRCADSPKKLLPTRNRKSSLCSFGLDSTTAKNKKPVTSATQAKPDRAMLLENRRVNAADRPTFPSSRR
jgi:hypothetical protein